MAGQDGAYACTGGVGVCGDNDLCDCGGLMVKPKRLSQEPTLLDLYAALASVGVIQKYGFDPLPAFVANKSFEIAQEMMIKREEVLKGHKDE